MSDSDSLSNQVLELAEEFIERCRRGERPLLAEYIAKHPQLATEIREVFPAMAMVERIAIEDDSLERDPVTPAVPELSQIGDYRIIREVGRGGMGVVYEAEQVSLGRRVAVKVLPRTVFDNDRVRKRFARESRAAARLHHTNIVPVFGVGEQDGLQYYVMQFIQGLGLDQVLVELRRLQKTGSSMPGKVIPGKALPQEISARYRTPEWQIPAHADISADAVARSLMDGRLGETLLLASDSHDSGGTQKVDVKENRSAVASIDADSSTADQGMDHRPGLSDTVAGVLSETARSGEIPLPGQSQVSSGKAPRMPYWRSVATIGAEVANALQHAHQQGIVHRDIKPANLLMDMRGNVWVTDFGLAKASDQQDLTHTGDILGTLRYMAPEQFEGTVDHRTDTYSLGLTLYELLALRPAFMEKDRHKLMKQVTTETPTPLKTLDSGLPTDLTTIVQKAIDRDPAHRYQSAQDMADDLERFLRDEPILARRISPVTRFVRWCKRNPMVSALTSTIAALLIVVAMGSTLAAFRFEGLANRNASLVTQKDAALTQANLAQKQAEEERLFAQGAKAQAEQAKGVAEAARDQEQKLRKEAELQRDRANTNFNRARRAVDQYLAKITENELLSVPGLQPLRQDLLAEALKFYAEFAEEKTDDPELQIELATAQYRLGVIQRELGNKEATQTANTAAIQQLEALQDRQLGGVDVQSILAQAYLMAGRYDDSVALCQKILETDAKHREARSTRAESYNSLAIDDKNKNDAAIALSYHQKAFEIRQQLANEHPDNAKYNAELGGTINNIGVLLGEQKKTQDALAMFQLAVTYQEKACKLSPHSILWGRWHALSLRNAAYKYKELGQVVEALEYLRRVVEIRDRLVFQNPSVSSLRAEHYQDRLVLADHLKQMGMTVEANRAYRDAKDVLSQLAEKSQTPAELFQLAVVYASLSANVPSPSAAETTEDPEAADERQRNADLALQTLQKAVDNGWGDPAALKNYKALDPLRERDEFQQLAKVVESVAEANKLLASQAKTEEGKLADQQKAVEILDKLAAEHPQQIQHQRSLATTFHSMGVIQTTLKQFEEAEKSLQQAIEMRAKIHESKPDDAELMLDWLTSLNALGQLHWQSESYPKAHQVWQSCLKTTKRLSEAAPNNGSLQQKVVRLERVIFDRYGQLGLMPLMVPFLETNTRQHRIFAVDASAFVTDGEFSAALLFARDQQVARDYFSQLAASIETTQNSNMVFELIHFVRGACLLGDDFPIEADVAEKVRRIHEEQPTNGWIAVAAAMLDYREQRYAEAVTRLSAHTNNREPQIPFTKSVITWKQGNRQQGMDEWAAAETEYRQQCASFLERSPVAHVSGIYGTHWWQFTYGQVMRRYAAEVMAEGQPVPDDPWPHLIQARGYSLIGETQKTDEEIAAATAAAPNDPEVWLAVAQLQGDSDELTAKVEEALTKSADAAANDPLPLVKRARWYAERGEREKAEADYAKAAALTPHELNKFLEAGWWVVGPYPPELREFCPPEIDADPSTPVHIVDPQTGLSDETVKWRNIATGDFGRLDLANSTNANANVSVYALSHVYSPTETTATLCISATKDARIWVNGDLVHHFTPGTDPGYWSRDPERLPIVLRQGLNTILVKATIDSALTIRLGDHPYDKGMELARFGEWKAAADLLEEGLRRSNEVYNYEYPFRNLAAFRLADGDVEAVRRLYSEMEHQLGPSATDKSWKWALAHIGSMAPGIANDKDRLMELAKSATSAEHPGWRVQCAAANYRAGHWQEVVQFLTSDQQARDETGEGPLLLAMAYHQLGNTVEAQRWLSAGQQQAYGVTDDWAARVPFIAALRPVLYAEAIQLLTGSTDAGDQLITDLFKRRRDLRLMFGHETYEFDAAVLLYPHQSHLYLARGKRLARPSQFKEAEADFNKAVELQPNDRDVLIERARFYAQRGNAELAAADIDAALKASNQAGLATYPWTDAVDLEFLQLPEIGEQIAGRLKTRQSLFTVKAFVNARNGDSEGAAEAMARLRALGKFPEAGATALMLKDHATYEEICREAIQTQHSEGERLWLLLLSPSPAISSEEILALAEKLQPAFAGNPLARPFLGMAYYRAGRYPEAIAQFGISVRQPQPWQMAAISWPGLAMANHHLGRHEESQKWLDRTAHWLALHTQGDTINPRTLGLHNLRVVEYGTVQLFYQEAKALIESPPE